MRLTRSTLCKTGFILSLAATGGMAAPIAHANTVELGSPTAASVASAPETATAAEVASVESRSVLVREAAVLAEMRAALIAQTTTPTPAPTPAPAQTRPAPAPAPTPAAPAPAPRAGEPQLFERASFINACRSSGAQAIALSRDVTRNQFVQNIAPNTRLTLTGVIAYNNAGGVQYVQVSQPALGYVPTATLTLCNTPSPSPTPTPTPPTAVRYRVVFPGGLLARTSPNGPSQNDGPAENAIVTDANPAQVQSAGGRRWRLVNYVGIAGNTRQGWVSETGPNFEGQNLVRVP